MRSRQEVAQHRGLLILAPFLVALLVGMGWWQERAWQQGRVTPVDRLLREVLAPGVRAIGGVRNRVTPDPAAADAPLTPVGLARVRALEEDNRQLRATLALRQTRIGTAIAAEIIGRNDTPWQGSLLLGTGAADGIRAQMVALTPEGVLGQVRSVTAHTAVVLPLTDAASGIGALVARTGAPGVLKGYRGGTCRLLYLPAELEVKAGDQVVTSGLGEIFPQGLPLGTITEVIPDRANASLIATVQPAANPATAKFVVVVGKE